MRTTVALRPVCDGKQQSIAQTYTAAARARHAAPRIIITNQIPSFPRAPPTHTDFIVVYDRATTGRAGKFKRFNLNAVQRPRLQPGTGPGTGAPAVLTAVNASSGQALTLTSLLPDAAVANVTVTPSPTWCVLGGARLQGCA